MKAQPVSQGSGGAIECDGSVVQGGTITITVGPNDTTLDIKQTDGPILVSIPVTPGKTVTLPVPSVPTGASLTIRLSNGERRRARVVEVLQPSP
jgi:hypothetical protein